LSAGRLSSRAPNRRIALLAKGTQYFWRLRSWIVIFLGRITRGHLI
jgi:hypothetical protein